MRVVRGSTFVGWLLVLWLPVVWLLVVSGLLGVGLDWEWLRGLVIGRVVMCMLGLRDQGAGSVIVGWILLRGGEFMGLGEVGVVVLCLGVVGRHGGWVGSTRLLKVTIARDLFRSG